jgi:hypothetical protein
MGVEPHSDLRINVTYPCKGAQMNVIKDKKHLKHICRFGQGEKTCRYLASGTRGIECAKHDPELRPVIDRRVKNDDFVAQGDNCEGIL